MATGAGGVILTSLDGSAWITQTAGTTQSLLGIAWAGDRFVAVGANNTRITLARPWGDLKPLIPYRWTMLGLPATSRTPTAANAFAGLDPAAYPDQWSVYDYNLLTKQYRELPPTAELGQDIGYWLVDQGSVAHTVQLNPPATATVVLNNPRCPSTGGCYEVPLSAPGGTGINDYLYNLVGMPLPYPVGWWEVRLEVDATTVYTLDDAQTAGYVEKNYWVWNGNDYGTYDSHTLGNIGVLQPWQGIWVKVWAAARGHTLKLLIPRIPKYSHIPPPSRPIPGWQKALDWLIPAAVAAETPTSPPRSWYVRLVAEEASQNLLARNSVLGQLPDSVDGYDAHDLPKLAPFGAPYLSVAFPHPDWGTRADDYASDYRPSGGVSLPPAIWRFEVRTDRAGYAIQLRWEGPPDLLGRMELVDEDTGARYSAGDPGVLRNGVPVTMTTPVRHFTWIFGSQPASLVFSGDYNGDARSDVIWHHGTTGQVYGMLLDGYNLTQQGMVYAEPNTAWRIVSHGDFNGDGRDELLWWNSSTGQVYQMPMNGLNITGGAQIYQERNTAWQIFGVGDLNSDRKADLVWWNSQTGQVYAMLMEGMGITQGAMLYREPNTAWRILAARDFNADGKADLLWRNTTTGHVYLMLMNGLSIAGGALVYQEPNLAWQIVAVGDLNGDRKADLVWWNSTTGQVYGMLMNGTAIAQGGMLYQEPNTAWRIIAGGDYTGDGKTDLLWRNATTGQVYEMVMNGLSIAGGAHIYQEANPNWRILATAADVPRLPLPGASSAPLTGNPINAYRSFEGPPVNPSQPLIGAPLHSSVLPATQ